MAAWLTAVGLGSAPPAIGQADPTEAFDAPGPAADTSAVAPVDELLSPDRWTEPAFGLSVRVPRGVQVLEQATDGALVKFLSPRGWTVSLFLRRSDTAMTLESAAEMAARQAAAAAAVALQDEAGGDRFAGHPMRKAYFLVPDEGESSWVLGQALMLADPHHLAVLQLEAQVDQREAGQAVFEAMLATATLADPRELSARREARIEAGRRFIASLTQEQRLAAASPERWSRITRGGRDIGYIRAVSSAGQELGLPGVGVRIRSRLLDEETVFDSDGSFFLSDDGLTEIWSVRTTARPEATPGRDTSLRERLSAARRGAPDVDFSAQAESSAETGIRAGQNLKVSLEGPGKLDELNWPVLPPAYLSQADAHLLPHLLPLGEPAELAFYAYNPDTESMALQTVRVIPLPDGRTRVYFRPAASRAEQVLRYDASGRLTARELPDGRVILPASRESIRGTWRDAGP